MSAPKILRLGMIPMPHGAIVGRVDRYRHDPYQHFILFGTGFSTSRYDRTSGELLFVINNWLSSISPYFSFTFIIEDFADRYAEGIGNAESQLQRGGIFAGFDGDDGLP